MGRRRAGGTVVEVAVEAPRAAVWAVLADPGRWPERTASMTSVELLGPGVLGPAARARIRQPRLPVMVWHVVAWVPGSSFVWVTSAAGVSTAAAHTVLPAGEGRSRLVLAVVQHGSLAPIVRLLTGRLTRRYLTMEAAGHKAAAERWSDARGADARPAAGR